MSIEISKEIRRNFHLFWDNFPSPVMLVYKDRTILDRNPAAEAVGCVPGTRCIDQGEREAHKGCLANRALMERTGIRSVVYVEQWGRLIDSYWLPLPEHEDIYVHFGIDITDYAAERFLRAGCCEETAACGPCTCE